MNGNQDSVHPVKYVVNCNSKLQFSNSKLLYKLYYCTVLYSSYVAMYVCICIKQTRYLYVC